jgi:hypothetical protein
VPFHWVRVPSSPPMTALNAVRQACQKHGARLCEDTIFYGSDNDRAQALIEVPDDGAKQLALLKDLGAFEASGKLSAAEKDAGKKLPTSHP